METIATTRLSYQIDCDTERLKNHLGFHRRKRLGQRIAAAKKRLQVVRMLEVLRRD